MEVMKELVGWVLIIAIVTVELYGLMRLALTIALFESAGAKLAGAVGVLLLLPALVYLNLTLIYVIGGGH